MNEFSLSKRFILLLAVFGILTLAIPFGRAQDKGEAERSLIKINLDAYLKGMTKPEEAPYPEIKRRVLGLYEDKDFILGHIYNPIQAKVTMVLNHLGYIVEPLNLRKSPLPDDEQMKQYDVIITWFQKASIPSAVSYLIWVEKQVAKGKKLIVLGKTGLEMDDRTGESYPNDMKARLLRLVGLEYRGFSRRLSPKVFIDQMDDDMVEFERKYRKHPGDYAWVVPYDKKRVKTWLSIGHEDFPKGSSSVVTTSKLGGYVMQGYGIWNEPNVPVQRYKWYINPFLFFEEILGNREIPVPDPTTKDGKRVFFTHIDGDSFHSFSQVERGKYSSEILMDFIANSISDTPIGVSFVVSEVDPFGIEGSETYLPDPGGKKDKDGSPIYVIGKRGNKKLLEIARKIAALPNVEIASHTYHHPYIWRGENRTSAYKREPFDVEFETKGSIDFINEYIAPEGKKVKMMFWTGDTTPGEKAFEILEEMGVANINGGDAAYDEHYNSLTTVSPYGRKAGKYWQVFSCQSNENLYTNLWRADFNGLENVLQTMKRTESPRRLQCANLYYHFYTGDRVASMNAIKKVYQWVEDQGYAKVFPSEYTTFVNGFYSTRVFRLSNSRFVVAGRGKLNTIRLDEGKVNLKKSYGVTQVDEINDSYYLSLDPKVKYPIIQTER